MSGDRKTGLRNPANRHGTVFGLSLEPLAPQGGAGFDHASESDLGEALRLLEVDWLPAHLPHAGPSAALPFEGAAFRQGSGPAHLPCLRPDFPAAIALGRARAGHPAPFAVQAGRYPGAVAQARLEGLPLICLESRSGRKTPALHFKDNLLLEDHSKALEVLRAARLEATSPRQGPVLVDIAPAPAPAGSSVTPIPRRRPHGSGCQPVTSTGVQKALLADIAEQLRDCEAPLLLLGPCLAATAPAGAAQDPWAARIRLAETVGAKVFTDGTLSPGFPERHPLHLGAGKEALRQALSEADLVLSLGYPDPAALGVRFRPDDPGLNALIAVVPPAEPMRQAAAGADIVVIAEPDQFIAELLGEFSDIIANLPLLDERRPDPGRALEDDMASDPLALIIGQLPEDLRRAMIVALEPGCLPVFTPAASSPRGRIVLSGPGVLPQAIGVALQVGTANPVLCICSENAALHDIAALWTARQLPCALTVLVRCGSTAAPMLGGLARAFGADRVEALRRGRAGIDQLARILAEVDAARLVVLTMQEDIQAAPGL